MLVVHSFSLIVLKKHFLVAFGAAEYAFVDSETYHSQIHTVEVDDDHIHSH